MTKLPCPLAAAAEQHGDLPALVDRDVTLSWSQTQAAVHLLADRLLNAGVQSSDRLAVIENNRIELPLLILANMQLGAISVLLSPRYPGAALSAMCATAGCTRRVEWPSSSPKAALPRTAAVLLPAVRELRSEIKAPSSHAVTVRTSSLGTEQPTTILFTSGSSGTPKAALHSFGNHYYNALGSNQNLPLAPGDRWLLSLPLYHVGGQGVIFRSLIAGGTTVFRDDKLDLAKQIVRDRITHLSLVPTQLRRFLAYPELALVRSSLKVVLLGGAPVPSSLLDQALDAGLPVRVTYGLTEMASQVATGSLDRPDQAQVLPYCELMIADDGEILVRGKTLFLGYVEGAEARRALDHNGWFHTGDIGSMDSAGALSVSGRKDNMFVSGGENIHPETIETALCAIEGIDEAIVVPVVDSEYGARPVAFVKYRPDINLSAAESELPEEVRFRFDHSSLSNELAEALPRFMLPLAFHPWPHGYEQTGLKSDRAFFVQLAAKLHRTRK